MASHKAQFIAHMRIVASRGKRFETIRSLQRLANLIYGGSDGISGLIGDTNIEIARPGGGQASQLNAVNQTDYYPGCAVKPQFGETPAQLMITGFYLLSTANAQAWPDKTVTHAGESKSGAGGAYGYKTNPATSVATEVQSLKAIIDNIIATEVPGENVTLFRLDYKNIIWGDRGFHFPR